MTIREDEAAHVRQAVRDLIDRASVRSVLRDWSDRSVVTPRGEEHDEELEAYAPSLAVRDPAAASQEIAALKLRNLAVGVA